MSAVIFVAFAVFHATLSAFGLLALMVLVFGSGGVVAVFAIMLGISFFLFSLGRDMVYRLPRLEALEHQERVIGVTALMVFGGAAGFLGKFFGQDFFVIGFSVIFLIDFSMKADSVYRELLWIRTVKKRDRERQRTLDRMKN